MSEPVTSPPARLLDKAEAETRPYCAGCYDCDASWTGDESRRLAIVHRDVQKHTVWVERQANA